MGVYGYGVNCEAGTWMLKLGKYDFRGWSEFGWTCDLCGPSKADSFWYFGYTESIGHGSSVSARMVREGFV